MWRPVILVWTDVSEERSSETSVHTRFTLRHIPEDDTLHNHRCENLKSYLIIPVFFFRIFIYNQNIALQISYRALHLTKLHDLRLKTSIAKKLPLTSVIINLLRSLKFALFWRLSTILVVEQGCRVSWPARAIINCKCGDTYFSASVHTEDRLHWRIMRNFSEDDAPIKYLQKVLASCSWIQPLRGTDVCSVRVQYKSRRHVMSTPSQSQSVLPFSELEW
jgi:hypothetical protein